MPKGKKLYREYDEKGNVVRKECSICGEIKSVDCFIKNKGNKDGYGGRCKQCNDVYNHQYRENHKDEIHAKRKQWEENNKDILKIKRHEYYENNKETIMKQHTEYRHMNLEIVRKWSKAYRENHKEELLEKGRLYQENNREKVRESNRKYYHRNKEKESERKHLFYENNKDKVLERCTNYRNGNVNKELQRIYENVTMKRYPDNGIQYGVIYGVYCKTTDRWYIGQTTKTFKLRYLGNFFRYKFNDLSEDSEKGQLLKDDIEKYGQESFEIFEVIDVAFSEKELDEKEAYYIDYYNAYEEGYNTNRGYIFKHDKSKRKEVI